MTSLAAQSPRRTSSFGYIDSLPSNWSKRTSFKNVPFSSLIHIANPVAALLSRRRVQAVFFILSLWMLHVTLRNSPRFSSHRFKFLVFETRGEKGFDTSTPRSKSEPVGICISPKIESFGLLLDGRSVATRSVSNSSIADGIILDLPELIDWNGWFFVTSRTADPAADPMRFALLTENYLGSGWQPVGSSSYAFLHSTTVLFHGSHPTSTDRGSREAFDPRHLRAGGGLWISVINYSGLAALGALGLEEWGRHAPASFESAPRGPSPTGRGPPDTSPWACSPAPR